MAAATGFTPARVAAARIAAARVGPAGLAPACPSAGERPVGPWALPAWVAHLSVDAGTVPVVMRTFDAAAEAAVLGVNIVVEVVVLIGPQVAHAEQDHDDYQGDHGCQNDQHGLAHLTIQRGVAFIDDARRLRAANNASLLATASALDGSDPG